MTEQGREFGFTPDWRAQVPFWLILPKTLLLVAAPVWIIWVMIVQMQYWDLEIAFILGMIAVAGGRHTAVSAERAANYQRKLRHECIVADSKGLRILPPFGEWRTFPWQEVTELRIITVGGLMPVGFTSVEAGGVTCSIPAWVDDRKKLLRLIRSHADLAVKDEGWWATVFGRY
ncbi:MAG: hypothetical protein R6V07_07360 [Armatimonadota bacterium]